MLLTSLTLIFFLTQFSIVQSSNGTTYAEEQSEHEIQVITEPKTYLVPSQLVMIVEPSTNNVDGLSFAVQPVFRMYDALGRWVERVGTESSPWKITASLKREEPNQNNGVVTLTGVTEVPFINGTSRFVDLAISGAATNLTIIFNISRPATVNFQTVETEVNANMIVTLESTSQPTSSIETSSTTRSTNNDLKTDAIHTTIDGEKTGSRSTISKTTTNSQTKTSDQKTNSIPKTAEHSTTVEHSTTANAQTASTSKPISNAPVSSSSTTTTIIIAVVVLLVVILFVMLGYFICYKRCLSTREKRKRKVIHGSCHRKASVGVGKGTSSAKDLKNSAMFTASETFLASSCTDHQQDARVIVTLPDEKIAEEPDVFYGGDVNGNFTKIKNIDKDAEESEEEEEAGDTLQHLGVLGRFPRQGRRGSAFLDPIDTRRLSMKVEELSFDEEV